MSRFGPRRRVAVIGAGIAGLAAAAELCRAGVEVVVLERERVVGGRVRTVDVDGAAVDVGAQFLATFYPRMLAVAHSAGIGAALRLSPQHAAIVHDHTAWRVDEPLALARSGLLSRASRARLLLMLVRVAAASHRLDPHDLRRAASVDYQSAQQFVRRWGGAEVAERFVEPVVRGLLYWDLATTSQAMLLVMLRMALRSRKVFRLDGGMARLPAAMAVGLDVRVGATVTGVHPRSDGSWVVQTLGNAPVEADGVVCAATAPTAARLVPDGATARVLRSFTYTRTAVVTYRLAGNARPPVSTQMFTNAAPLLASVNPPQRPGPPCFVRAFLSDTGVEAIGDFDDERLASVALDAVRAAGGDVAWTMGATAANVWRWNEALPRFDVGSLRSAAIQDPGSLDLGTLVFAGDYLGGPFLEGALGSGRAAARRLLARA